MPNYSNMAPENAIASYPHWKLSEWPAEFPPGRIDRIYTHWSAHDYSSVFPAYHYCVALDEDGDVAIVNTHDVRENMRDVYDGPETPYAQHTRKRNSYAIGISIMAMEDSRPDDFGPYPMTDAQIDGLCVLAAKIAAFYDIPIDADHVMSHAEAAKIENYFGTADNERWDIARLSAAPRPLVPEDAVTVGEELRRRMRAHLG